MSTTERALEHIDFGKHSPLDVGQWTTRIDDFDALRFPARTLEVNLAHALEELPVLALEMIEGSALDAREPDVHGRIEQQR
jgi:hypothetical protein